jgi:hypothetical protein
MRPTLVRSFHPKQKHSGFTNRCVDGSPQAGRSCVEGIPSSGSHTVVAAMVKSGFSFDASVAAYY